MLSWYRTLCCPSTVELQATQFSVLPTPPSLQPKVVTDVEDEELRKQMEELQLANEEVAGDDDASDQEAGEIND